MTKPFRITKGDYTPLPLLGSARHGSRRRRVFVLESRHILILAALLFLAIVRGPELVGSLTKLSGPTVISGLSGFGATPAERLSFSLCHRGGGYNCVVDGDTIWLKGEKIRLLDIDTPETHPPRCAREAQLGHAATQRLYALLNGAPVSMRRDGTDRYGRTLAVVMTNNRPVGDQLIAEGLARPYGNGRKSWC
ncbi:thermonuclease family protein [Novosphingopyxis baekryungensis]|uniref:thermonuclease family protein n=1 Tax=Novosphingopyxis baekryungensis TaxID=279369 RepID=UPI0003B34239|nr:thermonuclease family protein [Novosphingopyxis baekryungensis]